MQRIIATFHPQRSRGDFSLEVDPQGAAQFDVTAHFLDIGEAAALSIRDFDDSSDKLATLPQAPAWVRTWEGPFYVTVEQSARDYFEMLQVAWDWI
jgi:hypothetical protein